MTGKPQTGVPHAAGVLGFAGALPFVALTGSSFYDNVNVSLQSIEILRLYGTLILSFLGGIHWGLALAAPVSRVGPHLLMSALLPKADMADCMVGR